MTCVFLILQPKENAQLPGPADSSKSGTFILHINLEITRNQKQRIILGNY